MDGEAVGFMSSAYAKPVIRMMAAMESSARLTPMIQWTRLRTAGAQASQ
ncbi:hypothetical protein ACIPY6_41005 [Streptomyces sp. NPDC090054]